MYRKIIIGFNDSDSSRDALALGKHLGDATGASLFVVGICPHGPSREFVNREIADTVTSSREALRAQVMAAAEEIGGEGELFASTSPPRGLHQAAEDLDADLVVLGSSKRADPGNLHMGRLSTQLLHGAGCAVALAPSGYRDRAVGPAGTIGVGVDNSPESHEAVHAAAALAREVGSSLVLYGATMSPTSGYSGGGGWELNAYSLAAATEELAQSHLDAVQLDEHPGVETSRSILHGDAASRLTAMSLNLDLLFLGSRAYGPIRRVILGSVSTEVMNSASCPVVVVPRGVKLVDEAEDHRAIAETLS